MLFRAYTVHEPWMKLKVIPRFTLWLSPHLARGAHHGSGRSRLQHVRTQQIHCCSRLAV